MRQSTLLRLRSRIVVGRRRQTVEIKDRQEAAEESVAVRAFRDVLGAVHNVELLVDVEQFASRIAMRAQPILDPAN